MPQAVTQYDVYRQRVLSIMVEESIIDSNGIMIWEGALGRLIERATQGHGHYQKIADALRDSGAIKAVRRGGGMPSSYEICRTQYLTDDEGNDVLFDASDASPTRRNQTQLLQLGQRLNKLESMQEILAQNLTVLALEIQKLTQWKEQVDGPDRRQAVSTEQDQEAKRGDGPGSKPAPEHGVSGLGIVQEGESLSRRLGLIGD